MNQTYTNFGDPRFTKITTCGVSSRLWLLWPNLPIYSENNHNSGEANSVCSFHQVTILHPAQRSTIPGVMSALSEAVPRGNNATGVVEKAGSPSVRNKLLDLPESVIRADAPIAAASRDFQNFQTPSIPPKLHLAKFTIPRVPEQTFPGGRIGRAECHSLPESTAGRCVADVDKWVHFESQPGLPGERTKPKGIDRPSEDIHKEFNRAF
jgi:hypothetical protein